MYTYQEEKLADILEELKPLLQEHYKEIALYQDDIKLDPDYDLYLLMEEQGTLHVYTVRSDQLVGYCITFVREHPHYKSDLYAVNDIVYVHPDHRHTEVAPVMLQNLETIMQERGVSVMTFHMKTYKTFEALMDFSGFDKVEYLYSKLLKEN